MNLNQTVVAALCLGLGSCGRVASTASNPSAADGSRGVVAHGVVIAGAHLPLVVVADVDLPGRANRLDYQDIDPVRGTLVIAHMDDDAVVIVRLSDGGLVRRLPGIAVPRGIAVADDVGRIFVTSLPHSLVVIDNMTLSEIGRVKTGTSPDGVAWDSVHKIVGVSDQRDGAMSLLEGAGSGRHTEVRLGTETGNVVFDRSRAWFWITVEEARPPDQLVALDPATAKVTARIDLPGCEGAHGLRLHPDAQSAFVACEGNDMLARVRLSGAHTVTTAPTGSGPDVLSIDPGLGWIYVAAESGDVTVFDIDNPGTSLVGRDHPGANAHSVAADSATHRVFFPLQAGLRGTPVLRIMKPSGI